jgi:hypothetical protein
VVKVGRDTWYLWFALRDYRGEDPEASFSGSREWAEKRPEVLAVHRLAIVGVHGLIVSKRRASSSSRTIHSPHSPVPPLTRLLAIRYPPYATPYAT